MKIDFYWYVGRRMNRKGQLMHYYKQECGDILLAFKSNMCFSAIGERVQFTLKDETTFYIGGENKPIRTNCERHPDHLKWAAEEVAAESAYAQKKANKKLLARETEFERAIAPLIKMMDSLSYNDERTHFVNAVNAALWKRRK